MVIISVCSLPTPGQMGCSLCAQSGPRGCESPIVLPSPGKYKPPEPFSFSLSHCSQESYLSGLQALGKMLSYSGGGPRPIPSFVRAHRRLVFVQTQSPDWGAPHDDLHILQSLWGRSGPITSSISMPDSLSPTQAWPLCPS